MELLDPLEEKLHLSAAFIEVADRGRRQGCLISEEHQGLVGFGISEAHMPEVHEIVLARVVPVQRDRLIGDRTSPAVGCSRIYPMGIEA